MEAKAKTIYDLASAAERLEATIIDLIDEDEAYAESLFEYLDKAKDDLAEKVDRVAFLIEDLTARARAQKDQAKALRDAAAACENRVQRTKDFIRNWLESNEKTMARGKVKTIQIIGHGGLAPLVWERGEAPSVDEWREEHPDLIRTTVSHEIDLVKIRERLDEGKVVPGVHIGERGKGVRVK